MRDDAGHAVFIFVPVRERESTKQAGFVVDPVCGRALSEEMVAGRLLHDSRDHFFCSLACAEKFAIGTRGRDAR